MSIRKVKARKIFDSQAQPTLEVELITDFGLFRTSVPNDGRSNPIAYKQLRDNAVDIVNNVIGPELVKAKFRVNKQKEIDKFLVLLDGTDDKSKLGSIAMFAVSSACCKAGATEAGVPLYKYIAKLADNNQISIPVPGFSIISGGRFANNQLTFRDFTILPLGAENFEEAFNIGNEVYRAVEIKIAEQDEMKPPLPTSVTGAFIPQTIEDDTAAIEILNEAIKNLGYEDKVKIQIHADASSFYLEESGLYNMSFKASDEEDDYSDEPTDLKDKYEGLVTQFPNVVSIEDPFDMDDLDSWPLVMDLQVQIVCNELTATRSDRVQDVIDQSGANCVVVEPWRAGTVTESILTAKLAKINDWDINVSTGHGYCEDLFIVDCAVGISAGVFKAGAPVNSAKYNQLMRIEKEIGRGCVYSGAKLKLSMDRTS